MTACCPTTCTPEPAGTAFSGDRVSAVAFADRARPHVALTVRNLDRSLRFYEILLDRAPAKVQPEYAKFELDSPAMHLALNEQPNRSAGGSLSHLGIQVQHTAAGVALVDMAAWRWLYAHPDADPSAFRAAVVDLARDVWNRYFAALHGERDVPLLAIYSHMIGGGMYTPDYPLGHLIAFQIEAHFEKHDPMGAEFERLCRLGNLTPDAWMRQGVGAPLSADPMLNAAAAALEAID